MQTSQEPEEWYVANIPIYCRALSDPTLKQSITGSLDFAPAKISQQGPGATGRELSPDEPSQCARSSFSYGKCQEMVTKKGTHGVKRRRDVDPWLLPISQHFSVIMSCMLGGVRPKYGMRLMTKPRRKGRFATYASGRRRTASTVSGFDLSEICKMPPLDWRQHLT